MAQQLYRVVEANESGVQRVEKDIGCEWKSERLAKQELRDMKIKDPGRWLSIQKKK